MKRILAAAALAAPLALAPAVAFAGTSSGTTGGGNSIYIYPSADFGLNGGNLDLDLSVKCSGGTGVVRFTVDQYYPETPNPTGATGTGVKNVVCDGNSHLVSATIVGTLYDGGQAKAQATLTTLSGGSASTQRWITIIAH